MSTLESLLLSLRSVSESTRLRILAVLMSGELTVSELTEVLGQSQPRVSRHLKLLTDAGVIERHQEGSWVFYRLADHPVINSVRACIPRDDRQVQQDLARLDAVRAAHRRRAARYFERIAGEWDRIRGHHVSEGDVERRLLAIVEGRLFQRHVDLGTGTGRILQLFAPQTRYAIGIDNSREMLAVARSNLAQERFVHCQARYGDILSPDVEDASTDLVTLHHVLHYLENPAAAIRSAARILGEDGCVMVVDLAPHHKESLRDESAHRRLGFRPTEVAGYFDEAGLVCDRIETLAGGDTVPGDALDVNIWVGSRRPENQPTPATH